MLDGMPRKKPIPSPVVLLIAALALCVGGLTVWTVVKVALYVGGWPALAALVVIILALGLGTFIFIRTRKRQ
ncbi:hypothetical protein [Sinosporangium album]|uniref:hypothetical protein n=1 Tax=Sinosporangium album TaxID=504805 RepID=UPI00115FF410|nr:hypothetical protein [Sinosporangium album]